MNITNTKALSTTVLTPRQSTFLRAYTDISSPTFSNAYQSAIVAGYSDQFARNLTHLKPRWLSDIIGNIMPATIQPEQITEMLTGVVYDDSELTTNKLKAVELLMKYHGMLKQQQAATTVTLNVDLTGQMNK